MTADTIPPPYTTDSTLPSYDELFKRFETALGSNPTPQKCLAVADTFSPQEIDILADGSPIEDPIKREQDVATFNICVAQEVNQQYVQESLKTAAELATEAALRLLNMFKEVHQKIIEVDQTVPSGFEPGVRSCKQEFQDILNLCRQVADEIKFQGTTFDMILVPLCLDSEVPDDFKKKKVADFITSASSHEERSQAIQDRLRKLQQDYTDIVNKFGDWAKEKEEELGEDIERLLGQLDELQIELAKIDEKIVILEAVKKLFQSLFFFSFIPVVGTVLALAGVIGIGATSIALSAQNKKRHQTQSTMNSIEGEIDDKREQIRLIQATRVELITLGEAHLKYFASDINILDNFWQAIKAEAIALKFYIEEKDSADDDYIDKVYNKGTLAYKTMAEHIGDFGRGISRVLDAEEKSNA